MNSGQNTNPPSDPHDASDTATPMIHTLELPPLSAGSSSSAHLVEAAAINPLHQVKTQLQVCIGDIHMTVGELMAAREHQVLLLDRKLAQPVDVLLEGRVIARGELVAVDEQFAVRITELPMPLKP